MPRRYRYTKRVYPKKKWAFTTGQSYFYLEGCGVEHWSGTQNNLIRVPARINDQARPANTGYVGSTVKDIEVHFAIQSPTYSGIFLTAAIVYLPEFVDVNRENMELNLLDNDAVIYTHPEWILGYKTIQFDSQDQTNEYVVKSRIKKKLHPGDVVALYFLAVNHAEQPAYNFTNCNIYVNYSYKIAN